MIRSMHANTPNHEQSMRLMNCGDERLSRPSMGAWLTYGLGTENQNLPGFIAMCPGLPVADVSNWQSAFLPGVYQGTYIDTRKQPGRGPDREHPQHRRDPRRTSAGSSTCLAELNRLHQQPRAEDDALEARIASFELAYRMQMAATDAFDIEPGAAVRPRRLWARRPGPAAPDRPPLIERGVRFVQLYHGDVQPWDATTTSRRTIARWPGSATRPSRRC